MTKSTPSSALYITHDNNRHNYRKAWRWIASHMKVTW